MPGGGELPLVAFGNQNAVISGAPDMTHFYKVIKRYTHFSQETITIPMDGPNELGLDAPIRIRAKIPRHADLLTDLAFVFRVPEMFSPVIPPAQEGDEARLMAFRWIHMLGPLIIDNCGIYVGGSKVQEFPGEWIALRAQMDLPADQYLKWRSMVGDVPELYAPEWGIYGKSPDYPFTRGEYPHAVAATDGTAPSTPEREIRVPLPFWFTEKIGAALPLIHLQKHEVEVQITLRPLREIYRIMERTTQREPVRVGVKLSVDASRPTSVDPNFPEHNDNLTLQDIYVSYDDIDGETPKNFFLDPTTGGAALQDGFVLNAHLEGNYVYITEKEQALFVERKLQYLVHQTQVFKFQGVTARTKLDMDAHNLVHRIVFFGRRSDAIDARNDYMNLSNWKSLTQAPYWPLAPTDPVPNSGRLVPFAQRDILRSARILCAGNEIFEEKPATYYELQTPLVTGRGAGLSGIHPGSLKPDDIMGPIYQVPFAFYASDHEQPSGTLNTSRLREFQLEVNPWPLDPNTAYEYDFTVYVESLNFIVFQNGMAGMMFAV